MLRLYVTFKITSIKRDVNLATQVHRTANIGAPGDVGTQPTRKISGSNMKRQSCLSEYSFVVYARLGRTIAAKHRTSITDRTNLLSTSKSATPKKTPLMFEKLQRSTMLLHSILSALTPSTMAMSVAIPFPLGRSGSTTGLSILRKKSGLHNRRLAIVLLLERIKTRTTIKKTIVDQNLIGRLRRQHHDPSRQPSHAGRRQHLNRQRLINIKLRSVVTLPRSLRQMLTRTAVAHHGTNLVPHHAQDLSSRDSIQQRVTLWTSRASPLSILKSRLASWL